MSLANDYFWLSGIVRVSEEAPASWQNECILPFFNDPNNKLWGQNLSRYLYHESLHFWQFLASSYLADLVADDWSWFDTFEQVRHVIAQDQYETRKEYQISIEETPFSPKELMESWARYWDIHTRSPAVIIQEEELDPGSTVLFDNEGRYSDAAYNWLMQHGPDCEYYGRPYRWLVEYLDNSALAAYSFPILVHGAFMSKDPVSLLCRAAEILRNKTPYEVIDVISSEHVINVGWFGVWSPLVNKVILPAYKSLGMTPRNGLHILSFLVSHPVFREYPTRFDLMRKVFAEWQPFIGTTSKHAQLSIQLSAAKQDPDILFALPGIPTYRSILGAFFPPPRIEFSNIIWHADRSVPPKLEYVVFEGTDITGTGNTFAEIYTEFMPRVSRFRNAQKAVELGLAPDAFEGQ